MSVSSHCAPLVHAVIGLIERWVWGLLLALAKNAIHAACLPHSAGVSRCAEMSCPLWLLLQAMHSWLKLCEGDLRSDGCLARLGANDSGVKSCSDVPIPAVGTEGSVKTPPRLGQTRSCSLRSGLMRIRAAGQKQSDQNQAEG